MNVGFIGAGKVGFTLGKVFAAHGESVAGYYSRHTRSAADAAAFTHSDVYESISDLTADCDVLFLTVPDGEITAVYQTLLQSPIENKWICHCSGALTADAAFPAIQAHHAHGFSVHPLFAVSDKYHAYAELTDVFFGVEGGQGDEAALTALLELLRKVGLSPVVIATAQKTRYHCAAAMASNLVIGLFSICSELMQSAGFADEREALAALMPLIRGNIDHVAADGLKASLTGPVERGDATTVAKHLACFENADDRAIYRLLSRKCLAVARTKHPDRSYTSVEKLLDGEDQSENEKSNG